MRVTARMTLLVILVLGAVLHVEAVTSSYILDDYLHGSMVHGSYPAPREPLDLYDFVDDAHRQALAARGTLPWWADPRLELRFFRPLSSGLIWAEHHLLGDAPLALHVHSLLWWGAAVLAAWTLFRRLFDERPALIATAIFAGAPCHAIPLAWLANREVLISLTFGLLGLTLLDRARDSRRVAHVAAAAGLFALSLLGGEYALAAGAYVLAASLATPRLTLRDRATGLASFAAPAGAYLALRARLGYGTAGSGFYTDPTRDPVTFLMQTPRRGATLLLDAWLSLDTSTIAGSTPSWLVGAAFEVALAVLAVGLRRALGRLDARSAASARVLLLGSLLAIIPVLAVVPSPRLVGAPLIGVAGVVAAALSSGWFERAPSRRSGDLSGLFGLALAFAHLVHAPVTAFLVGRQFHHTSKAFEASAKAIGESLGDPSKHEVFVLRGGPTSFFLPFALAPETFSPPMKWRVLAHAGHVLARRRDVRTLDLFTSPAQPLFPSGPTNLFRGQAVDLHVGDVFTYDDVTMTILSVGPAGANGLRVEAPRDLDTYAWVAEGKGGFALVELPGVGFGKPFDP